MSLNVSYALSAGSVPVNEMTGYVHENLKDVAKLVSLEVVGM